MPKGVWERTDSYGYSAVKNYRNLLIEQEA